MKKAVYKEEGVSPKLKIDYGAATHSSRKNAIAKKQNKKTNKQTTKFDWI